LEQIQLTPSQQNQLEAITEQTQSQVKNLMSTEQQAQLKNVRSAIQSLNLSFQQRQEIGSILHSMRVEVSKILTPEQKYRILGGKQNFS
jgi:Spy/CpxP family protein refolding chaperone